MAYGMLSSESVRAPGAGTRLPPRVEPWALARRLARWPGLFLLLDYDGTLSDIAPTPEEAVTAPGAVGALRRLIGAPGVAVEVVSGRPLAELTGRLPLSGLWLVGEHGAWVRCPDGRPQPLLEAGNVAAALDELERRASLVLGGRPGWRVERKTASLALHYRQVAPEEAARLLPRIQDLWLRPMAAAGLELIHGDKVLEVRPRMIDKGRAVEWLLDQRPGLRPVYLGDDTADEDAFAAVAERGGLGVLVARSPRPSEARLRLNQPAEVVRFLTALVAERTGQVHP
ncbi:MAG: trehalose-phosphatase [Bacillota bacterium]